MKNKLIQFLGHCCLLLLVTSTLSAQSDPNVRDMGKLMKWFEGEFDNDSQIWFEGRRSWKGTAKEKHHQMHAFHHRIPFEELGKNVFYVEEYINNDTSEISRQRIASFESEGETSGIRMKIYFLKDAKKYLGGYNQPEIFDGITKEDLFGLDGCDVIFQRQGEQYHGSMVDKACQFGEGELRRYSVHDMIISENQYWRVDRTFLVKDDSFHKGHPNAEPHKMRKAKFYSCDVAFHEKAYYIPSEKDKKYKEVKIHNQGGMKWFHNPVNGFNYGVQLREKQYPFYEADGADFFMLRFIKEGDKASTVIVTSGPNPKSLSFQIGWASANCKLKN